MNHADKLKRFEEDLRRRGLDLRSAGPPLWRLLWRCGSRLPPPQFMGWPALFLMIASVCFAGGLLGFWIFGLATGRPVAASRALLMAAVPALFVGVFLSGAMRARARVLDLPPWKDYGREDVF